MDGSIKQPEGPNAQPDSEECPEKITIHVHKTTGGEFRVEISPNETAEELRRKISRQLQTPKERLKVLFKEQVLEAKPLKDYKICDGSKVTLLPSVESGFSSTVQGTQQSIIQAIESLSDPQIDDFLSGRLPLTLALRVGDHMMFVQLQLEQSQVNSQVNEPRPSRTHHASTSPFSQFAHSAPGCLRPRLFADMSSATPLGATAVSPKTPVDFDPRHSSRAGAAMGPIVAEPAVSGPAPKVQKLTAKSDATDPGRPPNRTALKPPHFHRHHHPSAPSSPDEVPYAIFDPRFHGLQQVTHHYNQMAPRINHHAQSGANHLHRLVTACSSLEQVVAIPPSEPLKVPSAVPEHSRKSSRKRPPTLFPPHADLLPPSLPQRSVYHDGMGSALSDAFIQNALMNHHSLGGFPSLPMTSLLSSAYAKYQESSRAASQGPSLPQSALNAAPASPPSEIRHKHPITTNMLQAASKHRVSRSERPHHHRRASTSGRLTSGSLSHQTSGLSGTRVARQMQRLRRLCGSHQQCVAYSNRELATEISSIVHMARHSHHHHHHHSRSEGSSHRRSHKNCRECHGRERPSQSGSTSGSSASGDQTAGACIDSFTTHGPGIFSGTFSGSLHPSIQDANGKPKRDPKTILQILTDLLSATQQYQGQIGNVGLLPQLFKDHFKSESARDKEPAACRTDAPGANDKPRSSEKSPATTETQSQQKAEKILPPKHLSRPHQSAAPAYQHQPHVRPFMAAQDHASLGRRTTPAAQYLSSVSTVPIGNLPYAYGPAAPRSAGKSLPGRGEGLSSKPHRHHRGHHHFKHHGAEKMVVCCSSSSCRRHAKQQMVAASYMKREHENDNTRSKVQELRRKLEFQRRRRQNRRVASKLCGKVEKRAAGNPAVFSAAGRATADNVRHAGDVESGKMEVQFDDIKDFSAETVTV